MFLPFLPPPFFFFRPLHVTVPVWTASFGVVFNFVGFDFAAALKHINIGISYDAITVGWNVSKNIAPPSASSYFVF